MGYAAAISLKTSKDLMVKFKKGNRKLLNGNFKLISTAENDAASCSMSRGEK